MLSTTTPPPISIDGFSNFNNELFNVASASPNIPSSMLLVDLSPISSQIELVSAEIRNELTDINKFFDDFFIQKKQSITSELLFYSQTLSENSSIC